ncbi:unnamed protein product [Ixodes hexagonus]
MMKRRDSPFSVESAIADAPRRTGPPAQTRTTTLTRKTGLGLDFVGYRLSFVLTSLDYL